VTLADREAGAVNGRYRHRLISCTAPLQRDCVADATRVGDGLLVADFPGVGDGGGSEARADVGSEVVAGVGFAAGGACEGNGRWRRSQLPTTGIEVYKFKQEPASGEVVAN